jgi:hypothetical protein
VLELPIINIINTTIYSLYPPTITLENSDLTPLETTLFEFSGDPYQLKLLGSSNFPPIAGKRELIVKITFNLLHDAPSFLSDPFEVLIEESCSTSLQINDPENYTYYKGNLGY